MSATTGIELAAVTLSLPRSGDPCGRRRSRARRIARRHRPTAGPRPSVPTGRAAAATAARRHRRGARPRPQLASNAASIAVRAIPDDAPRVGDHTKGTRAMKAMTSLFDDVDIVSDVPATMVAWVGGHGATRPARGRADRRRVSVLGRAAVAAAHRRRSRAPRCPARSPTASALPADSYRAARRRQSVRLRGARPPLLRRPSARPTPTGIRGRAPRRARRAHRGGRRPHARAVHHAGGRCSPRRLELRAARRARRSSPRTSSRSRAALAASPRRTRRASSPRWASGRAVDVPGAEPVDRDDRPAAVPSSRRPAAAGPPRTRRADAFAESTCPEPRCCSHRRRDA